MKPLNEYPTPKTDAYIGDQTGVIMTPGEEAMCDFARDLERKLGMCREALEAENRRDWALRNLESISDPLDNRLCGLKMEVYRTTHEAAQLRKQSLESTKPKYEKTH